MCTSSVPILQGCTFTVTDIYHNVATRDPSSGGAVTYAYLNRCSRQKPARTLYLYTLTLTLTVVSHQVTLVCNANATASFCQVTLANVSIPIDLCLIRVYRTQHTQRAYLLYRSIVAGLSLSLSSSPTCENAMLLQLGGQQRR